MSEDRFATAIAEHHAEHPPANYIRAVGAVGELAVAESRSGAIRRVVLVTSVDDSSHTLSIVVATNRIETATDFDAVVDRSSSGAPFDLVVEGELYGPIFPEQLDDAVGNAPHVVEAIAKALETDGGSLSGLSVGLPLAGPDDPRRAFKEAELADLMQLVSACRRWLAGGRAEITTLDPEVLLPPPVGTPREEGIDRLDELLQLLDSYDDEGYLLSVDLRDWLSEVPAADLHRWHEEYGVDIWGRLLLMALEERGDGLEATEPSDLRSAYLSSEAQLGTVTVDFVTSASHGWRDEIVGTSEAEPTRSCRGRSLVVGA